ncbi:MAG: VWA domain-containing protein [Bacteroidales bacterium]|nr:VWA domain-containing protein [Bacteroidales bacterium]
MKHIYKYILSLVVLFVPVLADAQDPPIYNEGYHIENGIATKKTVSETMDANGYYTLTLETFATGATSITQKAIPSDIVLALDLSTSMGGHRGEVHKLPAGGIDVSINDIESDNPTYGIYRDPLNQLYGYQISVLVRNNRCYLYSAVHSKVYFVSLNGELYQSNLTWDQLQSSTGGTLPNENTYSVPNTAAGRAAQSWHFNPKTSGTDVDGNGLYEDEIVQMDGSRIHELKAAVLDFIDAVVENDRYKIVDGRKVERDAPLGNKLAIVAWATPYIPAQSTGLLSLTDANITTLKNKASGFTLYDGTKPEVGLNQANSLLQGSGRSGTVGEDFLRTIVFFTDGQPDNGFDPAIASSYTSKSTTGENAIGATVYSVGLFSLAAGATEVAQDTQDFMNYVSSNYPDATTFANHGTQASSDYYKDVSTGDLNLSDVFKTIAQASGGSEKTVPSATQVVDGVTNSFTIPVPDGASAPTLASAQVTVFTRSINSAGTTWGSSQSLTLVEMTTEAEIEVPDPTKEYMSDANKVGAAIVDGKLYVMGFDYSKADGASALDGNWVGWRYPEGTDASKTCAGKELVIQFKIQGDPDATGGDSTQTNTADSGIYVPVYDEEGKFIGYDSANQYEVPHANVPINLVIIKEGLRHGESATIQIYRAPQSSEYNPTTGKLKPYLPNGDDSWENFSKVILTNKGEDGAPVTETLLCLDPTYVYLMKEDDWGWSYNLVIEAIDTSMQEKNPFIFTNTEKTDAVRHAEAASFNRFGDDLYGRQRTETVKSSKVKTFITTPATGSGK